MPKVSDKKILPKNFNVRAVAFDSLSMHTNATFFGLANSSFSKARLSLKIRSSACLLFFIGLSVMETEPRLFDRKPRDSGH